MKSLLSTGWFVVRPAPLFACTLTALFLSTAPAGTPAKSTPRKTPSQTLPRPAHAGQVWIWGSRYGMDLCRAITVSRAQPQAVTGLDDVVDIVVGEHHALALKRDGTVWSFGRSRQGVLGLGPIERGTYPPTQIPELSGIIAICVGLTHSLALRSNGTVWSWGFDRYDTATFEEPPSRYETVSPRPVPDLNGVVAVSAGTGHNLALKSDGTVWTWGATEDTIRTYRAPRRVPGLRHVKAVAAGHSFSLALRSDGSVWAWGSGYDGQMGDGEPEANDLPTRVPVPATITDVTAAGSHVLALDREGRLWAWGANYDGALGDGTRSNRASPVRLPLPRGVLRISAAERHCLALQKDGTVWAWGLNHSGQAGDMKVAMHQVPVPVRGLPRAMDIAAGGDTALALIPASGRKGAEPEVLP